MQLSEIQYENATPIDGYGPGFYRIGGQVIQGAILTRLAGTNRWDGYKDAASLLALADEVDVLLVGTGAEIAHIPPDLRESLEAAGIGVEIMSSPAACRTYNVLLSEGRRVAAALLPV